MTTQEAITADIAATKTTGDAAFRFKRWRTALVCAWPFRRSVMRPKGFRQSIFSLLVSTLAINILSLALPVTTLQVYDRVLPNPNSGTLPVLIAGVCVAIMLEAVLRLSRAYIIGRSGAAYEHRMSCLAMDQVLHSDLSRTSAYGIGEHLHRMSAFGRIREFHNGHALTVLCELIFVPIFFVLILYISGALTVVPALVLSAFLGMSLWKGKRLRHKLHAREMADDKRFNFLIETLEGVHTVKSFALERFFERRYEALEEDSTLCNYEVTQETASTFNHAALFSHLMVVSVISVGAWCVLNDMLTTGALIATLLLSGRMMQPIQKALALWTRYQDYALARVHIEELMNMPQHQLAADDRLEQASSQGELCLRQVAFQWEHQQEPILYDVELHLKRGDTVLISGAHGAGKSVLFNLIAGIYPSTHGSIEIDGLPIEAYPPEVLARHVGHVRTKGVIFRGTIRENITSFGQIDEKQAREVAGLLQVDKDVAKLPGGFDTFLNGNESDQITPGLKQRIAMVRTLAPKPRIILFDNADRALDKEGYMRMYQLLARLKSRVCMVLISDDHNISGLATQHYYLQDGRLVKHSYTHGAAVQPFQELRL